MKVWACVTLTWNKLLPQNMEIFFTSTWATRMCKNWTASTIRKIWCALYYDYPIAVLCKMHLGTEHCGRDGLVTNTVRASCLCETGLFRLCAVKTMGVNRYSLAMEMVLSTWKRLYRSSICQGVKLISCPRASDQPLMLHQLNPKARGW